MTKKRVIIIHSWHGNPDDGWIPWLKRELEKRGILALTPQMPSKDYPLMEEWVSKLKESVGEVDENTYFIGHSLGCITTLRFLEGLNYDKNVGGCVFVAGFAKNIGFPPLMNFLVPEVKFEKVLSHTGDFVCIFSDNDKNVSLEVSRHLEQNLRAKAVLESGKGHFRGKDNVNELPAVLEELLEMMN